MYIKILFKLPFTRFFLAYCRDDKYRWFSLYKKQFGYIEKSQQLDKIKINDWYYWEEV